VRRIEIKRVGATVDGLGEGLLWDAKLGALYWTDAVDALLHRLDMASGERRDYRMPSQIGSLALREGGGAVVALEDGFHFLDLESGATTPGVVIGTAGGGLRFNDGKVDRQGRFLAGTMHIRPPAEQDRAGKLYRLDADRSATVLERAIGVANGPCFSPDGATFYFTDSPRRQVYAYDYDQRAGTLGGKRLFVDAADFGTTVDGQTVDADGYVWSALFNIGKIARFDPAGQLDRLIDVPVSHPTNVAFGGRDLDILFLTSLSRSPNFTASEPGAGGLFKITGLGVTGLAEPRFRG
jgi:sugar lactone lactonase YvrE